MAAPPATSPKLRITEVPESYIPVEDPDILLATLRRATPLVLRRFCTQQLQRNLWDLQMLQPPDATAQVELQVSGTGKQTFHGFGGSLQRVPLRELKSAAKEAQAEQRSLYLVQCPIWSKGTASDACPAEHLLPKVHDIVPFTGHVEWSKRLDSVNLWASIGDTRSNLHYDSKHGLLVVLRGAKHVEVFPPSATPHLGAYAVHDPLRSHHSKVPHCCLGERLKRCLCSSRCWPSLQKAKSFQVKLEMGDALLIPEGWWHHVKTTGMSDPFAFGQPVAIAMNLWWRQFPREPKSARPYVLRRLLGDMLASRTAQHFQPRRVKRGTKRGKGSGRQPSLGALVLAAQRSTPPLHREWLHALRNCSSLPQQLATAATSENLQEKELLAELFGSLDVAQVAALLSSLDAAANDTSGEGAAALRQLWRVVPQRALVAKWAEHLRNTLDRMLMSVLSL